MSVQEFNSKNRVGHHKPWESGKYTAKDAFPELSKHNNVMATHLTLPIYEKYWDKVTPNGVTFDKCIQTGVDNPGNKFYGKKTGCVFGDEHSYEVLHCDCTSCDMKRNFVNFAYESSLSSLMRWFSCFMLQTYKEFF